MEGIGIICRRKRICCLWLVPTFPGSQGQHDPVLGQDGNGNGQDWTWQGTGRETVLAAGMGSYCAGSALPSSTPSASHCLPPLLNLPVWTVDARCSQLMHACLLAWACSRQTNIIWQRQHVPAALLRAYITSSPPPLPQNTFYLSCCSRGRTCSAACRLHRQACHCMPIPRCLPLAL